MKSVFDFESLEGELLNNAEVYNHRHLNYHNAKVLLTSTYNLEKNHEDILLQYSEQIRDNQKIQLILIQRGISALYALYWLTKYHSYTAAYGRARFLLEVYLTMRQLNKNPDRGATKWSEWQEEIKNDNQKYGPMAMTNYLSGLRRSEKGEMVDEDEAYEEMYDILSNVGTHPHSMVSALNDEEYTYIQEKDLLTFGLMFAFGISAQHIRIFNGTNIYYDIWRLIDPILCDIKTALTFGLPTFMERNLFYYNPVEFFHMR